jgi:hypothetical protein
MLLNSAQIRGFFEGDGGIQIRVDKRIGGLSFRPQAKFAQKTQNAQILEWIRSSLDPNLVMSEYDITDSSWLIFPFNSNVGRLCEASSTRRALRGELYEAT